MKEVLEVRRDEADRFAAIVQEAQRPAILRGAVGHWPLVDAARGGDRAFAEALLAGLADPGAGVDYVRLAAAHRGRFHYAEDGCSLNFVRASAPLAAIVGELLGAGEEADAVAVQGLPLDRLLPSFAARHPLALLPAPAPPRGWIGNRGVVATHNDPLNNIACVVAGRRRFTLFPPEQIGNLYMGPFHLTPAGTPVSMVHASDPDLARYPRFADAAAAASTGELMPGDAIFIPYGWFHHVEALAPLNMLVNYWWNDARTDLGSPFDALMLGMASLRALPAEQRRLWKAMFDHYVFLAGDDPAAHLAPEQRGILAASAPAQLAQMRRSVAAALQRGEPR